MSDEYQSIPVAVARAAVQASGQLVGLQGPEYWQGVSEGTFGSPWLPMFAPTEERPYPEFARVIIKRKDQEPREVVISWDEYAAELEIDDPEWLAKRTQKPMSIFGAEVERHAYRVVFADVLAVLDVPSRVMTGVPVPDEVPAAGWELPARDWLAEVKAADAQTLNGLYDEAREAGALAKVDGLQQAIMDRTLDLAKPKPVPPSMQPRPDRLEPEAARERQRRNRRGKRP